jgi:hypothetical protein
MNSQNIPNFENIQEKRKWLSAISQPYKVLVKAGAIDSINAAIMEAYKKEFPSATFDTFNGWKSKGYTIRKGAKAFILWGQPRSISKKDADPRPTQTDQTESENETEFFPVAHLFSSLQVTNKTQHNEQNEKAA